PRRTRDRSDGQRGWQPDDNGRRRLRGRAVRVVVVPPAVRWGLRIALRRVLPFLLAAERRDVQVTPGASHRLVAPAVDEVGPVDPLAVADEGVGPVPLVHAEVLSKSSVIVYHGISCQPIRSFRPWISAWGARETNASVVSRAFKWAGCATWSARNEQPTQARSG